MLLSGSGGFKRSKVKELTVGMLSICVLDLAAIPRYGVINPTVLYFKFSVAHCLSQVMCTDLCNIPGHVENF